jgi:hypothetical protein
MQAWLEYPTNDIPVRGCFVLHQTNFFLINTNMNYLKSPLNYIGGKEKLLSQIFPLFPGKINTFIDLFCGGCSVGLNVNANKVIFNDKNTHLVNIYNVLKNQPI